MLNVHLHMLALDPADSVPMHDLIGHSITYRMATGPRQGQKVFTLQTLPPREERPQKDPLARACGFSLHAGVALNGAERTKLDAGMDARDRATQEQLPSTSSAMSRVPPSRSSASHSPLPVTFATR